MSGIPAIAEFITARMDEDEAAARSASDGPWSIATAKTAESDELAIVSGETHIVGSRYEGGGVWGRRTPSTSPARTRRGHSARSRPRGRSWAPTASRTWAG